MDRPPATVMASAALAASASVGPYFAVEMWAPGARWLPLPLLVSDRALLAGRIDHARSVLARRAGIPAGEVEERVAASVVFLGLASRLVSPLLGAAVIGGVIPHLTAADLWWRPVAGGPWPVAATPVAGTPAGEMATGRQIHDAAIVLSERVHDLTGPLGAVFGAAFRVSQHVLQGNVASALAGACGMLAAAVPRRAEPAGRLTGEILALRPLLGAGQLVQPDPGQPRRFLARRSCCLLYRLPGAAICGDCVLALRDGPRGPDHQAR